MERDEILFEIQQIKNIFRAQQAGANDKAAESAYTYGSIDPITDFQLLSIVEKGVDTMVAEKVSRNF